MSCLIEALPPARAKRSASRRPLTPSKRFNRLGASITLVLSLLVAALTPHPTGSSLAAKKESLPVLSLNTADSSTGGYDRTQGYRLDEDPTGLLDEGMRYRDLDTGVFITKDPAGFLDGPNVYSYVGANPWSRFDPEGLGWIGVAVKLAIKGGNIAQAVQGITDDIHTLRSPSATVLQKVGAGVSLASNALPASINDVKDVLKIAETVAKDAKTAIKEAKAVKSAEDVSKETKEGVKAYETGTYKELKSKENVGDGLDIDHQPSKAAQIKAAEDAKGSPLTPAEKQKVIDEGPSVAVPKDVHQAGPTYGGKNTKTQIDNDAKDLPAAATRDSNEMVKNAAAGDKAAAAQAAKQIQQKNSSSSSSSGGG